MNCQAIIKKLRFEPIVRFNSCGNDIQRCGTKFNNVAITWETFFPFNIFSEPKDLFIVDLIVPIDCETPNGTISQNYYTEDGFGVPIFTTLEDSILFIYNYTKNV
jgi:hypothetical protein